MVFLKYMIKRLCVFFLILFTLFGTLAHADVRESEFSFAVIGDTRPAEAFGKLPDIFFLAIKKINEIKPDFVMHVGDSICLAMSDQNLGGLDSQWTAFRNAMSGLSMPFHITPGNEDIWSIESQDYYSGLFDGKLYYSFDYKNSHFIILDTEVAGFKNDIAPEERAWLENDLKSTRKENIFVFLHRPVMPVLHPMSMNKNTRQYLKDLFAEYNVKAVFSGHEHLYHKENHNGTAYYITGGGGAPLHNFLPGGAFYHFLVITVKGESVKVDVIKIP